MIILYNRCRTRHQLKRQALVHPNVSPWKRLYNFGDDISFLNLTGMNRPSFHLLLQILFPHNVVKKGRPNLLDHAGKLGLLLFYTNSTMQIKYLCVIFGITLSTASEIISEMLELLVRNLSRHIHAKIQFPTHAEMVEYATLVNAREELITNVIGFVDGLSLSVQCADDPISQSEMYNGFHHDTRCNNVLAFSPLGKIFYACINYPGSWHDSQVCSSLKRIVIERIGEFALCVDQGFPRSGDLEGKFVGPLTETTLQQLSPICRDHIVRLHNKYVSLRQAAEWGMRALQGTFCRLKSRLTSNKRKRYKLLYSIFLLHNFRTHYVGFNQIAEVFNPEYQQIISTEGYDRIARYFFQN